MGGNGSGRYSGFGKTTVEDCLTLNINEMVKKGIVQDDCYKASTLTWTIVRTGEKVGTIGYELNTLANSAPWIRLFYTLTRTNEELVYKVNLSTTKPHFGGLRWWFRCPGKYCNRRVAKLHKPPGLKYFACRRCYDLTYTSCQKSHEFDNLFRIIANDTGFKPEEVKRSLLKMRERHR